MFLLTEPKECSPNFFHLRGGCYSLNTKYPLSWKDALTHCKLQGGTLAKISREGLRFAFSVILEHRRPKPTNLFFGLRTEENWVWIDGTPLNGSLWLPGYPIKVRLGVTSCALMTEGSSKIKNYGCFVSRHILCQKQCGG